MIVILRTDYDFDLNLYLGDHPVPNRPYHVSEARFLQLAAEHDSEPLAMKAALAQTEDFDDVMYS